MPMIKHVTRIDSGNTHGWWVRMSKTIPQVDLRKPRKKIAFQKFFADLSYNSKDWALFQAVIYLDKCVEKIERQVPVAKVSYKTIKDRRKYGTYEYEVYVVRYPKNDRLTYKQFSITKHGEEKAYDKAIRWAEAINKSYFKAVEKDYKQ